MNERDERLIRNEALFRQVNERLRALGETFSVVTDESEFVCECSDVRCAERIPMTLGDYEGVRARPGHFLIVPGHEEPDLEVVVEQRDRWAVVRKRESDLVEADVEPDVRDEG